MTQKLINASVIASLVLSTALPVMASHKGKGDTGDKTTAKKTLDIACIANAVDKRETSIMSAFDVFAGAMKSAYQARKDALKAAWGTTDAKARNNAIRKASETFRQAAMKARKAWKSAVHGAWEQFRKDRNACGPGSAAGDNATEGLDSGVK